MGADISFECGPLHCPDGFLPLEEMSGTESDIFWDQIMIVLKVNKLSSVAGGAQYTRCYLNGNKVVIIYDIGSYIMFLLVIMLHLTVSGIMSKT